MEKSATNVAVEFDLPFLLSVRDSISDTTLEKWAELYSQGDTDLPFSPYAPSPAKKNTFSIFGGLPVYIPAKPLAEPYVVAVDDILVTVHLLRRVNPSAALTILGEVPGDRIGRASFSSVRVVFDLSLVRPEFHWNVFLFAELAIQAINSIIAHYRVLAERPWLNSVTATMLQSFRILTIYSDGTQTSMGLDTGGGAIQGMGGSVPDEVDSELRRAVLQGRPPPMHQTLGANILDYMELGSWRLACIEIAVYFEAWLSTRIGDFLRSRGEDADGPFKDKNNAPRSVTWIAKNLVKNVLGFDFSQTVEYSEWERQVRDPRNELVHGKRYTVSRDEAVAAYTAAEAAINLLRRSTPGSPAS